ncbi:Protein seele [Pseudolycoriella hygida]|uniref:Protein seele n=1 Tax=Pseudolycoriella hygida TaxID=35572 RepID=A0A9Q0MKC0_9DIPT|nr:Protein seele [Pseudolycoriella hygida]
MKTVAVIFILLIFISLDSVVKCNGDDDGMVGDDDANISNIKCLVCKATILKMEEEIKKVDPRKTVEVSGFRLDPNGKPKSKSIQYSKSETFLTELMESICEPDNFSAVSQSIIQKIVVNQMLNNNGELDFTPDSTLVQSLNHFCLEVLDENEDEILKNFMRETTADHIEEIICTKLAKYCVEDGKTRRNEL